MSILNELKSILDENRHIYLNELYHHHIPEYYRKISEKFPKSNFIDIPLNQIFLENFSDHLQFFKKREIYLCRDGLWGIYSFFKKNPEPFNFKSKLIIPKIFEWIIPVEWKDYCCSYSINITKSIESFLDNELIIYLSISKSTINNIDIDNISKISTDKKIILKIVSPVDIIEKQSISFDNKNFMNILNAFQKSEVIFSNEDVYKRNIYLGVDLLDMYFDYFALSELICENNIINDPYRYHQLSSVNYMISKNVHLMFFEIESESIFNKIINDTRNKLFDYEKFYTKNYFTKELFELKYLSNKLNEFYET